MNRPPRKDNNEPKPLYERQLDEILRETERTHQRRQFWTGLQSRLLRLRAGRNRSLPYSRLLLGGVALAIVGIVLQSLLPGLRGLGGLLILGGVLLFLSPVVFSLFRGHGATGSPANEKLWRGRPVVYGDDAWRARLNGLVRWFRGGSNRPRGGPPSSGRWR